MRFTVPFYNNLLLELWFNFRSLLDSPNPHWIIFNFSLHFVFPRKIQICYRDYARSMIRMIGTFHPYKRSFCIFCVHLFALIPRNVLLELGSLQGLGQGSNDFNHFNSHFIFRICPALGPNVLLSSSRDYQPVFSSPASRRQLS